MFLGLAALAGPARAADKEAVTLAYPALSVSFTLPYLAEDLGLFEKEGLEVKHLDISGLGSINALISGSVDFALASGLSLTRAAAKGQKLMALAALHDRLFVQIVMRKSIADAEGFDPKAPLAKRAQILKNHTIGVDFDQRRQSRLSPPHRQDGRHRSRRFEDRRGGAAEPARGLRFEADRRLLHDAALARAAADARHRRR